MEQIINIGDAEVCTFIHDYKKEIEIDDALWFSIFSDDSIIINDRQHLHWSLSKEELCTFIKLLVSHLELPLEFK